MKKFLMIMMMTVLIVLPITAKAAEGDNSIDTKKEKVNVYIFHSDTCPICKNAIEFFNSITDEYGEYFRLVKYEVSDSANAELMSIVGEYLEADTSGVPLIVIGETPYEGYNEILNEEIIELIEEEYENEEKFDIIDSLGVEGNPEFETEEKEDNIVTTILISVTVVAAIGLIVFARIKTSPTEAKESTKETMSESKKRIDIKNDQKIKKTKNKRAK